jgi:hypothetical protein
MGSLVTAFWILFDVAICLRTGFMTAPFSWLEWGLWAFVGTALAIFAVIVGHQDSKKHDAEIAGLNKKLTEQGERQIEQKGISLGVATAIGRGLDEIASKLTDPQSKAEISELRQEVEKVQSPSIVYDSFDETPVLHGDGKKYNYTHLWFRNEPTGGMARDVAARITWWDARYPTPKPMLFADAKWYEVPHDLGRRIHAENAIDLLPNNASHGLDLLIRELGAVESRALHVDSAIRALDDRFHVHPGIYKVKVTISCEGYTKDFWFRVATGGIINVNEFASPDGEGLEVRDAIRRYGQGAA